jgi:hypothetical protein
VEAFAVALIDEMMYLTVGRGLTLAVGASSHALGVNVYDISILQTSKISLHTEKKLDSNAPA